jgi:hypothetical protein
VAEFSWWCQIFGLCNSEFFCRLNNCHMHKEHLYSRVSELLNRSIYTVLLTELEDIAVTIDVLCFLFVGLSKPVQ